MRDREVSDELSTPGWLPPAVAKEAQKAYLKFSRRRDHAQVAVLRRLILDQRMERVWKELYRRRRTGEFFHPARPEGLDPWPRWAQYCRRSAEVLREIGGPRNLSEAASLEQEAADCDQIGPTKFPKLLAMSCERRQDIAAGLFFRVAHHYADAEVITRSEINIGLSVYNLAANTLRDAARWARAFELDVQGLEAAALDVLARGRLATPDEDDPRLVGRQRSEKFRGYVKCLEVFNRRVFGKSLLTTIATTANVVFEQNDLNASRVRQLVR
jgi:hypothetical protein